MHRAYSLQYQSIHFIEILVCAMSATFFLISGCVHMLLAVGLGAFGAHALENSMSEAMMQTYRTGNQYHFYHALGLIFLGILIQSVREAKWIVWGSWAIWIGLLLFSGSLYVLAISGLRTLGAITPFGGLAFLLGWALAAWGLKRTL
jgi:uncharacterized membrane protein YgdD (TMEM256/DUF423 family)